MKITKIAVFTFLCSLTAVVAHAQDNEYHLDETYQISKDGTVHLNSNDAEVQIKGSDRSDAHLVVNHTFDVDGWNVSSEGEFKMEVENRDGDLFIKENNTTERFVIGNVTEEYRITLEVPRGVGLDIQGDDDSYEISNIVGKIALSADDSEIELRSVKGSNFEFDIDDGTVRMDKGQGKLNLNMDDGEFQVRQANFTEIDAEADDGDMDITTSLTDDGLYLFDMDDGDLTLDISGGGGEFEIRHDRNVDAGSNFEELTSDEDESIYRLSGGKARIEIDTDDGDVELRVI